MINIIPPEIIAIPIWMLIIFIALCIAAIFSEIARDILSAIVLFLLGRLAYLLYVVLSTTYTFCVWTLDTFKDEAHLRRKCRNLKARYKAPREPYTSI